jgi:hypothetical protein
LGALAAGIGIWRIGFAHHLGHPPFAWPWSFEFWRFFLNAIGVGFGHVGISTCFGLLCVSFLLYPLVREYRGARGPTLFSFWFRAASSAAVMGLLFSVAIGRGGWGVQGSKTSRYTEFAIFLIPLTAASWANFLVGRPAARLRVLVTLWLVCAVNFRHHWSTVHYQELSARIRAGQACVARAHSRGEEILCPTIHPAPLTQLVGRARGARASYMRHLGG